MWLSNSATAAMLYPIALGVLVTLSRLLEQQQRGAVDVTRLRFGTALMLVIAYGASIGGVATPVGTPPNLIALGQLDALAGVRIPFFQWMLLGAPVMLAILGVLVAYMRWALPPEMRSIAGSREFIAAERLELRTVVRGGEERDDGLPAHRHAVGPARRGGSGGGIAVAGVPHPAGAAARGRGGGGRCRSSSSCR